MHFLVAKSTFREYRYAAKFGAVGLSFEKVRKHDDGMTGKCCGLQRMTRQVVVSVVMQKSSFYRGMMLLC
jgi:hypothetical protein